MCNLKIQAMDRAGELPLETKMNEEKFSKPLDNLSSAAVRGNVRSGCPCEPLGLDGAVCPDPKTGLPLCASADCYSSKVSAAVRGDAVAESATDQLYGAVMNIPVTRTMSQFVTPAEMRTYKEGHRDARHAAADLIAAFAPSARAADALDSQPTEEVKLDGWQPIETAPKTGRTLLLGRFNVMGKWRTMRGQWFTKAEIDQDWEETDGFEEGWYETAEEPDCPNCWAIDPTHWVLPPAAPVVPAPALAKEVRHGGG